jgi:hypothetical protein
MLILVDHPKNLLDGVPLPKIIEWFVVATGRSDEDSFLEY